MLLWCRDTKHYSIMVKSQEAISLCSEVTFPEMLCSTFTVQRRHERRQKLSADKYHLRICSRELESKKDNQAPWFLYGICFGFFLGCGIEMNYPLLETLLSFILLIIILHPMKDLLPSYFLFVFCYASAGRNRMTEVLLQRRKRNHHSKYHSDAARIWCHLMRRIT